MSGSIRKPLAGVPREDYGTLAHGIVDGTGDEWDGKALPAVVLADPVTGDALVPGALTLTSLSLADGADVAEGSTTDLATANTVIGRLKKIVSLLPTALTGSGNLGTAVLEALPAGTNVVGGVTVADGADVALGTSTDNAGDPTVVGQLKALTVNTTIPTVAAQTASYDTTGAGTTVDVTANPVQAFSVQVTSVTAGAAASSWTVNVEGSLDGTNWTTVLQHQNPTDAESSIVHVAGAPVRYLRANVDALTLGADATAIKVSILGTR